MTPIPLSECKCGFMGLTYMFVTVYSSAAGTAVNGNHMCVRCAGSKEVRGTKLRKSAANGRKKSGRGVRYAEVG